MQNISFSMCYSVAALMNRLNSVLWSIWIKFIQFNTKKGNLWQTEKVDILNQLDSNGHINSICIEYIAKSHFLSLRLLTFGSD